ncbi:MAG: ABC transporter ATP-binding protein [Candidatus Heimdallarchaeum endolithica]|uniref:Molybdate/tungstate import ATP-binding protein WtpC n=1 Tax=Candidatus Heimdallarchaeum endolithica TaxID=2876572 RepID=A0A9Y1BPR4_9ARCH|nr:MAG: ABC transporter ATP-binding protein [Candidatus Heimdallarchaeum endolithica]
MLEVNSIRVTLGKFELKDITFSTSENDSIVILGPSGSGKTSLLKTILGIYTPDEGTIFYRGKDITYFPLNKRQIAYVPQKPTLFPHMTVQENLEYALTLNHIPKQEREKRINNILEFMGLEEKRNRLPKNLSGGELHRISIGRALILDFPLILLDEPLSGIDKRKAKKIIKLLKKAKEVYNKTIIYVTHDINDATELANKVIILNEGQIERFATPEDIMENPKSQFIAEFFNFENIFSGFIYYEDNHTFFIPEKTSKEIKIFLSDDLKLKQSKKITITIRPEEIILSPKKMDFTSARNCFKGKIIEIIENLSSNVKVVLDCGIRITAVITRTSKKKLDIKEGKEMCAVFKASSVYIID